MHGGAARLAPALCKRPAQQRIVMLRAPPHLQLHGVGVAGGPVAQASLLLLALAEHVVSARAAAEQHQQQHQQLPACKPQVRGRAVGLARGGDRSRAVHTIASAITPAGSPGAGSALPTPIVDGWRPAGVPPGAQRALTVPAPHVDLHGREQRHARCLSPIAVHLQLLHPAARGLHPPHAGARSRHQVEHAGLLPRRRRRSRQGQSAR